MPATRVTQQPSQLHPFDVVALYDDSDDLLVHAMLCNEAQSRHDVVHDSEVDCVHMGPPLRVQTSPLSSAAIGTAGLQETHRRKVKTFVDDRLKERFAEKERLKKLGRLADLRLEYLIHPPAMRPSGAIPMWRFSCVGFVLQAYQTARIKLLGGQLPLRSLTELKQFYPWAAKDLDVQENRIRLGIGEGERWPVALVGYVLNSLARNPSEIHAGPFVPQPGHEYFPPRPLADRTESVEKGDSTQAQG